MAILLAAPLASATFTFTQGKSFTADASASGSNDYAIPFQTDSDGYVYAKLLDTPGSVINSSVPNPGWSATMTLQHADASSVALGTFTDGSPSVVVPVASGEIAKLLVTLKWPAVAVQPGVTDILYGAIAFRTTPDGASSDGSSSGGTIDASRAWNVQVRFTDASVGSGTGGTVVTTTPSPTPAPTSTTPPPSTTPSSSGIGSAPITTTPTSVTPPVGALPVTSGGSASQGATPAVVLQQSIPTWFLLVLALQGAAIVLLLASHLKSARRVNKLERDVASARQVPVVEQAATLKQERR